MRRWSFGLVAGASMLVFAAAVGCGNSSTQATTVASNASSAQSTSGTSMGGAMATTSAGSGASGGQGVGGSVNAEYPPPPYGNQVGDTFPYLVWEGYVSTDPTALANTEPWTPTYTSEDVHTSGAPYALIHTALSA